ncbi:MAG: hypothetical protein WC528_01200 [Patescibacteria group bacterium]
MWLKTFYFFDARFLLVVFCLLGLWFFWQYVKYKEIKRQAVIFAFLIFLVLFTLSIFLPAWQTYKSFAASDLNRYYLPPYSNYYYQILQRQLTNYFSHILAALIAGLIFWLVKRLTHGLVIDQSDVGLLAFGALVAGWPNLLIFFGLVFLLVIITGLVQLAVIKERSNARFIITPYLPVALILTLFVGNHLSLLIHLEKIRF